MNSRLIAVALCVASCVLVPLAGAQQDPETKKFMDSVDTRLKALEQEKAAKTKQEEKAAFWPDFFKFYGDFRLRHETIDTETTSVRHRSRIRARINMDVRVNEEVDFGFRIATGESTDPLSPNQTLTGGFAKKSIFIDKAMIEYRPDKNVRLWGGKMDNPFLQIGKSDLVWDTDLTPEGLAVKYLIPAEGFEAFVNAAGFWINEKSTASDDTGMFGAQAGVRTDLGGDINLTAGAGLFAFPDSKNEPTFFSTTNGFGNSTTDTDPTAGVALIYNKKFQEFELFAEIATRLAEMPFSVYGTRVKNAGTSTNDQAWLAGVTLGKLANPGDWALNYNYRVLHNNALIGAFTDADAGGGGTNYKGHKIWVDYQISKKVGAGITYYRNETGLLTNADADYHKFQFDFNFKF